MIYSHFMDLIGKLVSLTVFVFIMMKTGFDKWLEGVVSVTPNPRFFYSMALVSIIVVVFFTLHHPVVDVFITRIYVLLKFKVKASWSDAKLLRNLFCLNRKFKWQPMNEVKELPVEERLSALLKAANE